MYIKTRQTYFSELLKLFTDVDRCQYVIIYVMSREES